MQSYDAIVVGGGFAGLGAAFALSDGGARVMLVEPRPSIGWEAGWTFNLELAGGISKHADQLRERLGRTGGMCGDRIDPVVAELNLLKMAEGRFDVLHYCHPVGVLLRGGLASGLEVAGKSGAFKMLCRVLVDATNGRLLGRCVGDKVSSEWEGDSVFSFFMNGVDGVEKLPKNAECPAGRILFKRTPWKEEVAVEYESSRDIYSGRLLIPEMLEHLRKEFAPLRKALMTHASVVGLSVPRRTDGIRPVSSKAANLFSTAAMLEGSFSFADRDGLLARLMESGEKTAPAVLDAIEGIKMPGKGAAKDSTVRGLPSAALKKDVIVCGGGTSGAVAAIAAAREGAKTLVVESSTCLGGIGTGGTIHVYYHGVAGGLQDEIDSKVQELTTLFSGGNEVTGFHPEVKKIVLQRMAVDAGAEIMFENTAYAVKSAGGKKAANKLVSVKSVVLAGPARTTVCSGNVFVDCTGDGDVAAMAGADCTFGRPSDCAAHPYSQSSCVLWRKEGGRIALSHHNYDAGYCDPTDPWDMTRARTAGILQYWKDRFDENGRLLYFAPILGLRNSRQVAGDYSLKFSDEICGREFDDVVAYSYSHYDNHASDSESESVEAMFWCWGLGMWGTLIGCEIPYRTMLPAGIANMLVACRALSMDFDAHNQMRMMRDMQRTGEAAGIAAALSSKMKTRPRNLDVKRLQERLAATGALKKSGSGYHNDAWKPEKLHSLRFKGKIDPSKAHTLRDLLKLENPPEKLRAALKSADPKERAKAALFLAFMEDSAGLPELIRCVDERLDLTMAPEGTWWSGKAAPIWKAAVALLGEMKCSDAVPSLENILQDPKADQGALVAAVKALGKIGDGSSANAIRSMLCRSDLPSRSKLQGGRVELDVTWRLELAAAESLRKLGADSKDLAGKYLKHPSGCVRRYARKILSE